MSKQTFALEHGGPKRLMVSWKRGWKNLEAELDGRPLITIPTSEELKEGREIRLDAERVLRVQLNSTFFGGTKLLLSVNGRPLPGSARDPQARLDGAVGIIYFVGALGLAIGVIVEVFSVQFFKAIGFGWGSAVEGLIFLALGRWVQKRHSLVGLAIAVGLYSLDAIIGYAMIASQPGGQPPPGAPIVKILFIIYMSRGFSAITDLRRESRNSLTAPTVPR